VPSKYNSFFAADRAADPRVDPGIYPPSDTGPKLLTRPAPRMETHRRASVSHCETFYSGLLKIPAQL
jgi:hypothetical protein